MDFQQLVESTETTCNALAQKADSVIKAWGRARELQEGRESGKVDKTELLIGLWNIRCEMQTELGRMVFDMSILHDTANNGLNKLEYTQAKASLLKRVLKPLIQTQEVINRAQGAADMVSIMLRDAVEES